MKNYFYLNDFYKWIIFSIVFSLFFLWDLFIYDFNFKYFIFPILIIFLVYKYKENITYNFKLIIYFLIFFLSHLILNYFLFNIPIEIYSLRALFIIAFLFLFIDRYLNNILFYLKKSFELFPLLISPLILFDVFININEFSFNEEHTCQTIHFNSSLFKLIFVEYSHYGMIFSSIFFYNLFILKEKLTLLRFLSIIILIITAIIYGSTTLYTSQILLSLIFLIFFFKKFNKYQISILLVFTLIISSVFLHKKNCLRKITDINNYVEQFNERGIITDKLNENTLVKDDLIKVSHFLNLRQNLKPCTINEIYSFKCQLNKIKPETLNFFYDELNNIIKNNNYITKQHYGSYVNVSTQVLLKAFYTSYQSLLDFPFGVGLDNYQFSFYRYNVTELENSLFSWETYYINFNDASSNFPKLLTEFGIFILVLFLFLAFAFFKSNIKFEYKLILFSIIITQLIRAAGYFNGGFIFSLILLYVLFYAKQKSY